MSSPLSIGYCCEKVSDVRSELDILMNDGYSFISVPLFNKVFLNENTPEYIKTDYAMCDLELTYEEWGSRVVGKVSEHYLNMLNSDDNSHLFGIINVVKNEILYGCHLSVPVILINLIENYTLLSSICMQVLPNLPSRTELWINLVISDHNMQSAWTKWAQFISMCNYHKAVSLTIEFEGSNWEAFTDDDLDIWLGENVSGIILPTTIFKTNSKQFPILSPPLKRFVQYNLKMSNRVIIRGEDLHGGLRNYFMYIKHLHSSLPGPTLCESYGKTYEDQLQIPLQPLANNLESGTYDIFEKDPIKYKLYNQAVYKCLCEKYKKYKETGQEIVIMVVGAGRGPLVNMAIEACIEFGCNYIIYALEKNLYAINTLNWRAKNHWSNVVVVHEDMRHWNPPEKADIMISELLGSFGDNELSPECLDDAMKLLKENGVSIPSSYTSYIAPVSAGKVYSEIVDYDSLYKSEHDSFQIPYVVNLRKHRLLSLTLPCFTFNHTPGNMKNSLSKFKQIKFSLFDDFSVVHGFAGYFSCVLYDDIVQSINPDNHSPDMFSWFPLFFPLKNPIINTGLKEVILNIWRINDGRKVWYEWSTIEPHVSMIHNSEGSHYKIEL